MKSLSFTILGPPRTKKTSNRVVRVGRFGRFTKVLPSEAHEEWFRDASRQMNEIVAKFRRDGHQLPIEAPVHVKAIFYREAEQGDWTGFTQALADLLGWKIKDKYERKKWHYRSILLDDKQIRHWDGTRLRKDAANPRIEVEVHVLEATLLDDVGAGVQEI